MEEQSKVAGDRKKNGIFDNSTYEEPCAIKNCEILLQKQPPEEWSFFLIKLKAYFNEHLRTAASFVTAPDWKNHLFQALLTYCA